MFGEGMKIEITNFIKKVNNKKGYMMILLSATHFFETVSSKSLGDRKTITSKNADS